MDIFRFEFLVGRQHAFSMSFHHGGVHGGLVEKNSSENHINSLELSYVQINEPLLICDGFFLESCVKLT